MYSAKLNTIKSLQIQDFHGSHLCYNTPIMSWTLVSQLPLELLQLNSISPSMNPLCSILWRIHVNGEGFKGNK